MKKRPRIVVTNDDGIYAPGIFHLAKSLESIADLFIVAPEEEKSGSSLGISFIHPLAATPVAFPLDIPAWKVSGTPADCIKIATVKLIEQPIDFVVSGINPGSNAGQAVLYSGTVGGVIEGAFRGIPGIGFSCINEENPQFEKFYSFIPAIVKYFLQVSLPQGTILNVNFPDTETISGIKMTRQGSEKWIDNYKEFTKADNSMQYLMHGGWDTTNSHIDSDFALLRQGYITVVPIYVHELTCNTSLTQHKMDFENSFKDFFKAV